jgi:hypothetical protein
MPDYRFLLLPRLYHYFQMSRELLAMWPMSNTFGISSAGPACSAGRLLPPTHSVLELAFAFGSMLK